MATGFKKKQDMLATPDATALLQALVIILAGVWIYWPVLHGDWLWDDDVDITGNSVIRSATGLWSIWFEPGSMLDFYPIKSSVQWAQWHLWGRDTLGYHLTNLVLHLLSAFLVWRLLGKLGLRLAWLGGLLFVIHPTMVESVAWIAELKNTLSLPPFLLAMFFYLDYDAHGRKRDYLLALGLFLIAMLCKPSMVTFPVVILLYSWWKRGRIGTPDLQVSAPFFIISLVFGWITFSASSWYEQYHDLTVNPVSPENLGTRLALAGLSSSFYFSKAVLPVALMPIYPRWNVDSVSLDQFLPWPVLVGVTYALWTKRKTWGRHILFGLGFFFITLAPFVVFNVGGYTSLTWVMDHFLYISIIGLIGLTVAALDHVKEQLKPSLRPWGGGVFVGVLVLLTYESHSYAKNFVSQEALWTYEARHNPNAWSAHNNLGYLLMTKGQVDPAMDEFNEALSLNPNYAEAHGNRGLALVSKGRFAEALEEEKQALNLKPQYIDAENNWGMVLIQLNRPAEAIPHFQEALKHNGDYAEAQCNWGSALVQMGRADESIEHFQEAVRINPDYVEAQYDLGIALFRAGQPLAAIAKFQEVLRIKPDYTEAHNNYGAVLAGLGRKDEAAEQFQEALRLDPDNVAARNNLVKLQAMDTTSPRK